MASGLIPNMLFAQFTQQGNKLVGTGASTGSYLGGSVAISSDGNTAIVGAYGDNNFAGAVWMYTRSGGAWTEQGSELVGTGAVGSAWQGLSVSISSDGNTAVVGGYQDNGGVGAVWVYTRSGGVWTQQGNKLVGTGGLGNSLQGTSVRISGDGNTIAEGGYGDSTNAGAIWIFTRSGSTWTQQGSRLVGNGTYGNAYQGYSVSISSDGNTAIEGGFEDNSYTGAVWVFTRSGSIWSQQGGKLVGTGQSSQAYQGASVAISSDGNTFIESGFEDIGGGGACWIFTRSGGIWTQQGSKLVGTGGVGNSYQGYSVAISPDGNAVVVGGYGDNSHAGCIWVFTRCGGVWSQLGTKLVGTGASGSDVFQGSSVTISSEGTVIEGGRGDNNNVGAVWAFNDPIIGVKSISYNVPSGYSLLQNYPNPFNPSTNIGFRIVAFGMVSLKIYDILGREVAILVNEQMKPGSYEISWDATNYASGMYFYKLSTGNFVETKKMVLIK